MNQLSLAKRTQIVRCLVEGNSIRSTVRITGAAKNTVSKLLFELGEACNIWQDFNLVNLDTKNLQVDEIWSFVGMKAKNVPEDKQNEFGYGDVWTWTAIDADSKLVFCWHLGMRDTHSAVIFMRDVCSRLKNRVQLTTDGLLAYPKAVAAAFGSEVDYAVLRKIYHPDQSKGRYSPPDVVDVKVEVQSGEPEAKKISTSYVERQNLTMRMGMRRFTRLTNGFSKKLGNHSSAIGLHFMYYNFCRKHQTLKTSPAVAAGLTDHVWSIEEMIQTVLSN